MFESAELGHTIKKSDYEQEVPALREALLNTQLDMANSATFPVIILIGGLDGLIINYGTLGIQLREVDPNEFARKYNGITTVFLTEVVDVPNCHSLICDNKGGIAMVISHLVEEHHLSRILFMLDSSSLLSLRGSVLLFGRELLNPALTAVLFGPFSLFRC